MYSLSCKDMGVATCNFVAKGATKEDVVKMAQEHAMKEHPKESKEMMMKYSKEEMEKMMTDKVMEEM